MRLDNFNKCRSPRVLFEEADTGLPLDVARYPKVLKHMLAKYEPAMDIEGELEDLRAMAYAYPPKSSEDSDNFGVSAAVNPGTEEAREGDYEGAYKSTLKEYRRCQSAFKRLMQRLQMNPISGLRGANDYYRLSDKASAAAKGKSEFGGKDQYIIIAADVDDMKYLNDKSGLGHRGVNSVLKYIGDLFKSSFAIENTKAFHPHGDEFRVISYIGKDKKDNELTEDQVKVRFIRLLQGCMEVSNKLASTGFYQEGWDKAKQSVQPTISFGISTTDTAADGVLTHVKTGASGGKPMKYAITIDRDIRFNLGFNPEDLNHWVNTIKKSPGVASVGVVDPPEVAVYDGGDEGNEMPAPQRRKRYATSKGTDELPRSHSDKLPHQRMLAYQGESKNILGIAIFEDKMPMDESHKREGAVVLECSWDEIPPAGRERLKRIRDKKIDYLKKPGAHAQKVGDTYVPLSGPYQQ